MDFYGPDLAWVHDDGFSELAEAAARMALELLQVPDRAAGSDIVVGDLGCGGGTTLAALADGGCTVWGVDLSPAMLAVARTRCPDARLHHGSIHDDAILWPRSDGILAVGEVLSYDEPTRTTDPSAHRRRLEAFFRRSHDTLRPGGFLLFDVATTGRAKGPTQTQRSGRDWRVEATTVAVDEVLIRTIDAWRRVDGAWRHSQEVHRSHLLDPAWVQDALAAAGFRVERWGGYDDYPLQPGWDAFMAQRN